jgi:hypothetical protein
MIAAPHKDCQPQWTSLGQGLRGDILVASPQRLTFSSRFPPAAERSALHCPSRSYSAFLANSMTGFMQRTREPEADLIDRLSAAFASVPGLALEGVERAADARKGDADAIIRVTIAGRPQAIAVKLELIVHPREAREAIWRLRDLLRRLPPGEAATPLLAAHAISLSGRNLLIEHGIGYFDLGGSLYLPAPGSLVMIDRPPPRRVGKMIDSIFEGKSAHVLHAVFDRREKWGTVADFAVPAHAVASTASRALTELERREWVEARGRGPAKLRRISQPGAMLDGWTDYLRRQGRSGFHRYHVPIGNPVALMHRIHEVCREMSVAYALTGEGAAQLYAPSDSNISGIRCRMIAGEAQRTILQALGARPVSDGWNLGVIDAGSIDDLFIAGQSNGVVLASPLQVYLDLMQGSESAREFAAHLRREKLDA